MEHLIIGSMGRVAAINPINGDIIWETKLKASHALNGAITLLIEKEEVYAGCQGHLFCLDRFDGHILWHNGLKGWGYNAITIGNESQVSGFSSY